MNIRRNAFAPVLIALALPACATAQQPGQPMPGHAMAGMHGTMIHVSATGSAVRAPEQAVVRLAVETAAPSAREAARQNAEKMERLIAALRGMDIPRERIQTVGYHMFPEYRPNEQRTEPEIIGYRVMNMVAVTVDGPERAGAVIDASLEAGANRVDGLEFQLRDVDDARREALRDAMQRARAEAEVLAAAAGLTLGEPVMISSAMGGWQPPMPMMERMAMGGDMATPVEPGTLRVQAMVEVHYSTSR